MDLDMGFGRLSANQMLTTEAVRPALKGYEVPRLVIGNVVLRQQKL